jgi:hypothetical protein
MSIQDLSADGSHAIVAPAPRTSAPPSWPWLRSALIFTVAAQLITSSGLALVTGTVRLWREQP